MKFYVSVVNIKFKKMVSLSNKINNTNKKKCNKSKINNRKNKKLNKLRIKKLINRRIYKSIKILIKNSILNKIHKINNFIIKLVFLFINRGYVLNHLK